MSKQIGQRIAAIVLALLFLVTSLGFSGLVLWQMHKDSNANKTVADTLKKQQPVTKKEGTLEGTKLQDFTPVAKVASLEKIDTVSGTGDGVKPGDTVTAHYTGAVASTGVIFQSSHDSGQPIPFGLNKVIAGWTEGVPGMKVGGKRRLLIPAEKAYGSKSQPGIPANSDLVFDIELVKIGE